MWQTGVLRGHSENCPHRVARVYHQTAPSLTQASNPDFPNLTHAVTVAVSLQQVENMIFDRHAQLKQFKQYGIHEFSAFSGGSFKETVLWMWHCCRQGIAVSIRNSKVALFVPFCNPDYQNTWSRHAISMLPPVGLPGHKWWANGWLLCGDKPCEQLCGDTGVTAMLNMLMVCCRTQNMKDCDFVINRRDSACVRLDKCDAMNPIDAHQMPQHQPKMVPVLSQYTGNQFADVAMPLATDWHRLSKGSFQAQNPQPPTVLPKSINWYDKLDCAVFRGSLTGTGCHPGTHQRLALLQFHDNCNFNLCATGTNQRLRYCPLDKIVCKPDVTGIDAGKHHYIPMHKQQEQYRYTITIDGHSGADRLATLCSGQQIIFKVDSPWHALCNETWASQQMYAWEHYIPVDRNLSNLCTHLMWARQNDAACQRLLRNCSTWSKTERTRTIQWWCQATKRMNAGAS